MSQTIGGALTLARTALRGFLDDGEADREARLILGHATGRSQASLLADLDGTLGPDAQKRVQEVVNARQQRQPLSQLLGEVEFYGRRFAVNKHVLTPRPDTETLVDIALAHPFERVLDLGTGSGCILASLLAERHGATGVGVDLSDDALAVATRNVTAMGLEDRATLKVSDWISAVDGSFDLIVSNPPYIAADEMASLAPEVHDWEPHIALTPGVDGLDAYRKILEGMEGHLGPGGRLIVEIGYTQAAQVVELFTAAGLENVACHSDLSGKDRVISGWRL